MIGLLLAALVTAACPAATEIRCEDVVQGTLANDCPTREFIWNATEGTFLDAFLSVSGFAPRITLIGPDGVEIKTVRSITGARLMHDVLVSGPYRIVVAPRENDVPNGPFTLRFFCNTVCRGATFVSPPVNQVVRRGQRAVITARAVSPYPVEYVWYDVTAPQTPIGQGPTFTTPPLNVSATYQLIAVNQCGSVPAPLVTVTVGEPRRRPSR